MERTIRVTGKGAISVKPDMIRPEFRINYTIKDTEAAKNQLLGKAVADSKEKAKVLTEAAGVALGDIITIDYSWGEISFISEPMTRHMSLAEECCMMAS